MLRTRWLLLLLPLFHLVGCTGNPPKTSAPVVAEKPKAESELAFITISKKAAVSLQIQTQPAVIKEVHERLALTGWIMARPGNEVTLTAPAAGYVQFPKGKNVPVPGESVQNDQELLQLEPVLSPLEQIQVAGLERSTKSELIKADTTLKTAESEFSRIEDLHKQNLRSKQEFDQALKARDIAREDLAAAKDKLTYFKTHNMTLKAPQAGTILQVHAGPGQYVPVSAPLITIIDLNPVWIRVPVPEYDLPLVDPKEKVRVTWKNPIFDHNGKPPFFDARPTGRVAQVDPIKHTADLWYELGPTKDAGRFVKDQMVTVHVPIGRMQQATLVPYSALVFDAYGHSWLYLDRTKDNDPKKQYERRRVELVTSVDDGLVIRPSLAKGDVVVTKGAAELFSREFHKAPVHLAGEDE